MLKSLLIAIGLMISCSAFAGETVTLTKDNTIAINDVFYGSSVAQIIKQAKELDARTPSADPIYLVINSPGGEIDAGLELIENLNNLKRPVVTISLFSASMSFQTVQGVKGERLVTATGTLMSHRAAGGFFGQMPGSLGTRYAYYLKRVLKMDENAVRRSGGKLTKATYATLIQDEYWCDGQDCIDQGLADKIVSPACDKSLVGTQNVSLFQDIMYGHTIELKAEYDNCPLNTNAIKYSIYIDGSPLFDDVSSKVADDLKKAKDSLASMLSSSSYYYSSSSSDTKSPLSGLNKEEIYEINKKIQSVMDKKANREVVKGY